MDPFMEKSYVDGSEGDPPKKCLSVFVAICLVTIFAWQTQLRDMVAVFFGWSIVQLDLMIVQRFLCGEWPIKFLVVVYAQFNESDWVVQRLSTLKTTSNEDVQYRNHLVWECSFMNNSQSSFFSWIDDDMTQKWRASHCSWQMEIVRSALSSAGSAKSAASPESVPHWGRRLESCHRIVSVPLCQSHSF